jgi:hypothetical protein
VNVKEVSASYTVIDQNSFCGSYEPPPLDKLNTCYCQRRLVASLAPSAKAASFDHTMLVATFGDVAFVPNPQSTPATTRSRPTMFAYRQMR